MDLDEKLEKLVTLVLTNGLQLQRRVGPGLLESVYEDILPDRLETSGLKIDLQQPVNTIIDRKTYRQAFRFGILVEGQLFVEIKSNEKLGPVPISKTLAYIRLMNRHIGLLLNFGSETFKQGIRRMVNDRYAG